MNLPIVHYGDPVLRAKGARIETVDEAIRELAANMIETMHKRMVSVLPRNRWDSLCN